MSNQKDLLETLLAFARDEQLTRVQFDQLAAADLIETTSEGVTLSADGREAVELYDPETLDATLPKFPHVHVRLTGTNGNAFAVLGKALRALKDASVSREEIDAYQSDATSGDYDHLLLVTMRTVDVR